MPVGELAGAALALVMFAEPAAAQFGFFPAASPSRHRARRHLAPVPAPAPPSQEEDVPLPVPRPAFPSDAPVRVAPTAAPTKAPPAAPAKEAPPSPSPPAPTAPAPPPSPAPAPQTTQPTVAPSGARLGEAPGQPDADAACPGRLKARGVDVVPFDIGPQPDPRCTVVDAVRLRGLALPDGGKIEFPDGPTLACVTADAFSLYVRDLLSPLAKGTYGVGVASVWTGPGLECRARDHVFGAKLSAHGQGLAVDIAQIKLADGRLISVGEPKGPADESFQAASRAGACGYFHTALGPGTDSYHRNHWHFDLEVRGARGDTKYCR